MTDKQATQTKPFTDDEEFCRLAEKGLMRIWEDLHALQSWLCDWRHSAERAALMREIKRLRRYERATQTFLAKSARSDEAELACAQELLEAQDAVLNSPDTALILELTQQSTDAPDAGTRTLH